VRTPDDTPTQREVICPASAEGGHAATCNTCRLCCGNHRKARNVVIAIHHAPFLQKFAERTFAQRRDVLVSLGTDRLKK
jgi:hypothetical protein